MSLEIDAIIKAFNDFQYVTDIGHICNDSEYDYVKSITDILVDRGAMQESHPDNKFCMLLFDLIYSYDQRYFHD